MEKVSVVIPVYGQWSLVKRNIDALLKHDRERIKEIIIVDDCSLEKNNYSFDDGIVKIISNKKNKGYTGTVNNGLKQAESSIIILLDSDAYPLGPIMKDVVEKFISDQTIGCLGFKTVDENGSETGSHEYEPSLLGFIIGQKLQQKLSFKAFKNKKNILPYSCSVSFRRACLEEINFFDEVLFPVLDADLDISMRIHRSRWKLLYYPKVAVYHRGGNSYKINSKRLLLFHESRWMLLKKHGMIGIPFFTKFLIKLRIRAEMIIFKLLMQIKGLDSNYREKAEGRKVILHRIDSFT